MADETRKFEALDSQMRVLIKNLDGLMRVRLWCEADG